MVSVVFAIWPSLEPQNAAAQARAADRTAAQSLCAG
jgi:hypothetical protein